MLSRPLWTSRQMDEVLRIQRDIVRSYEDDMVKYAEKTG